MVSIRNFITLSLKKNNISKSALALFSLPLHYLTAFIMKEILSVYEMNRKNVIFLLIKDYKCSRIINVTWESYDVSLQLYVS